MFNKGDRVILIPNSPADPDKPRETAIVTDPYIPTSMRRLDGTPVVFYVGTTRGLYHEASLKLEAV